MEIPAMMMTTMRIFCHWTSDPKGASTHWLRVWLDAPSQMGSISVVIHAQRSSKAAMLAVTP
jgi:hypothetical protein